MAHDAQGASIIADSLLSMIAMLKECRWSAGPSSVVDRDAPDGCGSRRTAQWHAEVYVSAVPHRFVLRGADVPLSHELGLEQWARATSGQGGDG